MTRSAQNRVLLAALCAAQFMLILDVVVIYVALPSIAADLGLADTQTHLVGVTYTVAFGSLLVVSGRTGDLLGRRRLLLAGLALFAVASLGAGLAQEPWHLLTARVAQGVGAAMTSANALAALNDHYEEGAARNAALGWWAMVGSAGAVSGQLLGGLITQAVGWRGIFWVNIPVGAVVFAVLSSRLRDGDRRSGHLDLRGSVLLATAIAGTVVALVRVAEGGFDTASGVILALAAGVAVLFRAAERGAVEPVPPLGLLRLTGVRIANLTLLLNAGGLGATLFFVTLYLQQVLSHPPLAVAAIFAPVTLVILLLSPRAASLAGRVGVRVVLTAGLATLAAGMVLLARLPVDGGLADVLPGMLLLAVGSGLSYAPTFIAAASAVPGEAQGAASGLISSMQELGTAMGLAVLALVAGLASTGTSAAGQTAGYRAGLVGAALMLVTAALVAARTPREIGRTDRAPAKR